LQAFHEWAQFSLHNEGWGVNIWQILGQQAINQAQILAVIYALEVVSASGNFYFI